MPCHRERTHDFPQLLAGTFHILWPFPCSNQELPLLGLRTCQRHSTWHRQTVPWRGLSISPVDVCQTILRHSSQNRRSLVVHSAMVSTVFSKPCPKLPPFGELHLSRCQREADPMHQLWPSSV